MCISTGTNIQYLCIYYFKGMSDQKSNEFNRGQAQSERGTKCTIVGYCTLLLRNTDRQLEKKLIHVEFEETHNYWLKIEHGFSLSLSLSFTHKHKYSVVLIVIHNTLFPVCYLCPCTARNFTQAVKDNGHFSVHSPWERAGDGDCVMWNQMWHRKPEMSVQLQYMSVYVCNCKDTSDKNPFTEDRPVFMSQRTTIFTPLKKMRKTFFFLAFQPVFIISSINLSPQKYISW